MFLPRSRLRHSPERTTWGDPTRRPVLEFDPPARSDQDAPEAATANDHEAEGWLLLGQGRVERDSEADHAAHHLETTGAWRDQIPSGFHG